MGRSPRCSKDGLNKGAWSSHEDKILIDHVKTHGEGKWSNLAKETGLKRCGKSCRLRWMNYLRPDIKRGNIAQDEEELIIRLHKLLGNRWSLIAGRIPGRTDNEIKNYWNSYLAKKLQAELPSTKSYNKTEKRPTTKVLPNEANLVVVTPQDEVQNHNSKLAMEHTMDKATNLVKNQTTESEELSDRSPSSMYGGENNMQNFLMDLSSEDFSKILDSEFAKLSDDDINLLNNAVEGGVGGGDPLLLSEEMEKSPSGSECVGPNMESDFQSLFLESDDGWLGDDINIVFSD